MTLSLNQARGEFDFTNVWSLILAGGEGERTRPFIERWLGRHQPKQYCTFVGTRSMLQHTWARANQVTSPARMVTVCAKTHQPLVWRNLEDSLGGQVVFQPENRDTAAGIFLPLTYIRAQDPDATVVVFPSDHFIFPEDRFIEHVRSAALAVDRWQDRIILLAAAPSGLELEYGWVEPGTCLGWVQGSELRSVNAFVEKPGLQEVLHIFGKSGLWNTFVMVAKVKTLWSIGWRQFPDLMHRFEKLSEAINTSREEQVLEDIYHDMPRYNFSSTLLQREIERIGVMELQEVLWSDWGRPERIVETLQRIGGLPRFSLEHVNVPTKEPLVEPEVRRPLRKPGTYIRVNAHQVA